MLVTIQAPLKRGLASGRERDGGTVKLSTAQTKAIAAADDWGYVIARKSTLTVLVGQGLIRVEHGWTERHAGRYHKRGTYATESVWGVTGHRLTDAGRELRRSLEPDKNLAPR